ncbi:MAG: carboxylesterase family protein, partial [Microthrixaceae bacterium]|nr:carboxylesterase family protein [Microthrixaceae bacterium]
MGRRGIIHGVSGVGCLLSVLGCGDAGGGAGGGGGAGPVLDVTIDSGPIEGKLVGSTRAFLGIPYAAAPVGDLRFRSPQPVEPWTDTRAYTEVGPGCPQSPVFVTTVSEDCLTLNVWTPAAPSSAALPVMVFLHGGAFVGGSGGQINYDGQRLSESGRVIVVTINYRLGPLGFLSHPALAAEDPAHATSGMYGLEDQTAALAWVKANAAAFGGDPGNVTIFGESAGGISACLHLVMPASAGLFDRAIIESGPCDL